MAKIDHDKSMVSKSLETAGIDPKRRGEFFCHYKNFAALSNAMSENKQ